MRKMKTESKVKERNNNCKLRDVGPRRNISGLTYDYFQEAIRKKDIIKGIKVINIKFKGLFIGNFVFTTKNSIKNSKLDIIINSKELQTELNKEKEKATSKWLEFKDITPKRRKTKEIQVWNKQTNENLGEIRWYGGFRSYVFDCDEIRLGLSCLKDIVQKMEELIEERKKKQEQEDKSGNVL
jgi:hypothetical protein